MRQRKPKNLEERLMAYSQYIIDDPSSKKGLWAQVFDEEKPVFLEIGCGKGRFVTTLAKKHPENNYIAIEGQGSVLLRALEKIEENQLTNVKVVHDYINDIGEIFEEGELDGIYLNFSDPWPKDRHSKRRLTHRNYLLGYGHAMKPEGCIEFKTDNDGLFDFTLEEITDLGYTVIEQTRNLHQSQYISRQVMTEYEHKFSSKGKKINYVKWTQGKSGNKIREYGGREMIFAQENNRKMPKEDKIFAISGRAKAQIAKDGKEAVINGTIGSLLDDEGDLVVLSSVAETITKLEPVDFAEYAPIGGTPAFKEAVKQAAFGAFKPTSFVEVCATPGGTGAIRNTVSNYSQPGDVVLTSDWYWAPYNTICQEIGRSIDTYPLFNDQGGFNIDGFKAKVDQLMDSQKRLVILLNTPAHNPTGYSLNEEDWTSVCKVLAEGSAKGPIALFVDVAYIDFAGDEEEYRFFYPILETLPESVLPIIGYSGSKTLTLYGMRCGAMIAMAKTPEIAAEFKQVTEFSSRGTWSNCVRASQTLMAKIYEDPELLAKVGKERADFREMLISRGKAFEEALREEGLENVPFDAGFFTCIASDNPDAISAKLEEEGIYTVPLAKGIRVSVASISKEKCVKAAKAIARVMKNA